MSEPIQQRVASSELRRWCPIAKTHQDADDIACGWIDCLDSTPHHRLRLRRMLICNVCEMGFFKQEEFKKHECWSAY